MFSSLLLDEPVIDAIESLGFVEMTDVQEIAIPLALEGKDLVVNARTGSGKTACYLVPLIQQILDNPQFESQVIVLAPTRELCRQINKYCKQLSKFTDISTAVIIGGEDPKYQVKALGNHPEIIIGTPGRILEHVKREAINLDAINILVLDEADRMLDLGFSDNVIEIAGQCNHECQSVLYSASFNQSKFETLIEAIFYEPEFVIIDEARTINENIFQQKILVDDINHRIQLVQHFASQDEFKKIIVFANKKDTVHMISQRLQSAGITSAELHSDVEQEIRNQQLRKFRNNEVKVIVATDLASRGLDVPEIDLVINFDVPKSGDDYMHRIGRTGRMHKAGNSITFVHAGSWNKMVSIENFTGIQCELIQVESLPASYEGPEHLKSSGKAYGIKRKKNKKKKDNKKTVKTKNRVRDRKNIGKRRKPSEKKAHD